MACTRCIKDWFHCGVPTLRILGLLTEDTDYFAIITTPQGRKFRIPITTDNTGHFSLSLDSVPFLEGLFNPYAGMFTLQVESNTCEPASWNDSPYCDPYVCVEFEAVSGDVIDDGDAKDYIGCDCP